jgi:hypothetical protein
MIPTGCLANKAFRITTPIVRFKSAIYSPCCLPFGKADDTASPVLAKVHNSELWLHLRRLGSAASSTFATLGFTQFLFIFSGRLALAALILGMCGLRSSTGVLGRWSRDP